MTTKRKRVRKPEASLFDTRAGSYGKLAIRPEAMSLLWLLGMSPENETIGASSVVSIDGPLEKRASWWDGYDSILERFREACADANTTSVVLRLSSPGGSVEGLYECVRLMREAKAACGKRVVAFADESAYSAAYAIACVADEVYLPPSGGVGSVGVICVAYDRATRNAKDGINVQVIYRGAHKADGHPDMPLTDDALAGIQHDVDALADMFHELVASARGVTTDDVAGLEAATFLGEEAIGAGLADGIFGFDEVIAMLAADSPATEENSEDDMGANGKQSGTKTNAEFGAKDAMSAPIVAAPPPAALAAAATSLDPVGGVRQATVTVIADEGENVEVEEGGDEEPDDTDEGAEDEGGDEEAEGGDEDEEAEEEGEDEEAEEEEKPKGARPAPSKSATSGDVLRTVRELTGQSTPGAIIGALHALADGAKATDKAKAAAKKAKAREGKAAHKALVDSAIRKGKMTPASRAFWMGQSTDAVRGYLATVKGGATIVTTTKKPTKPQTQDKGASAGAPPGFDASVNEIAKKLQMDPEQVRAHGAELRGKGIIH